MATKLTAEEARNLCPPQTSDEVFGNIRSKAKVGGTDIIMRTLLLTAETRDELLACGYCVRDGAGIDGLLTEITW